MSGIRKATMSRYLLDLSDKLRTGDSGYKLINRDTDPEELRRNMYTLAPLPRCTEGYGYKGNLCLCTLTADT
jgi:hypothetical protein